MGKIVLQKKENGMWKQARCPIELNSVDDLVALAPICYSGVHKIDLGYKDLYEVPSKIYLKCRKAPSFTKAI